MADSTLDPEVLRKLLDQLQGTDVDELELVAGETRVIVRREPGATASEAPAELHEAHGAALVAPLAGVFYGRPSPELLPYVSVGSVVSEGDVVALIETMKLFNEVVSELAGEVAEILHSDGDVVEAGQPLMYFRQIGSNQ
ncbi:MAG: acetyl-CoA carboxylase biotin carboxyl carrier protein [Chloroflexota bacterium]